MRWYAVFRTVPGTSFWWGALHPMRRLLALRKVLPWKFRQVCRSICSVFGKLGTLFYGFSIPGAVGDVPCFFGAGDVTIEAELRHKRRRKHAVIARRFSPLSGQEPGPAEFGSHARSRELREQAFDDDND